jgi:hypothetical protein
LKKGVQTAICCPCGNEKKLNRLHLKWVADLEHFTSVLKRSDVPKKTVDILVDALDPINERIAQMQNRAMIGN